MANRFNVWSFADNRAEADKGAGARRPSVLLHRCNPDNPWHPESVEMTPRQARIAGALLLKAADMIEIGAPRFKKSFI